MIRRRLIHSILIAILGFTLTGCWDHREINDIAFVLASGVDLNKKGDVIVSALVPLPGQLGGPSGGGGGTGGSAAYYIPSAAGKTASSAFMKMQRTMSRRIYMGHRRVIVIGEDYAKRKIHSIFDEPSRNTESRMTTYVVVSQGSALKLLNTTPNLERFSGEAIRELVRSGHCISISLKKAAQAANHTGEDIILPYFGPAPGKTKKQQDIDVLGYAEFKGSKMIGAYTGQEADALMWMYPNIWPQIVTIPMEKNKYVSLRILDKTLSINPKVQGNKVTYNVSLNITANLLEDTTNLNFNRPQNVYKLEGVLNTQVKEKINQLFQHMKKDKVDSLALGQDLYRHYPDKWNKQFRDHWRETLASRTVLSVKVKSQMINMGLITRNLSDPEKE